MITGKDLLERLRRRWPTLKIVYRFPFTRIQIADDVFASLDDEDSETLICGELDIEVSEFRDACNRLFFRVDASSVLAGFAAESSSGGYWVRTLTESSSSRSNLELHGLRFIHFYGYKGGQARSSTLAFLSKALAQDGWRVLAIDVDAEAPTLDTLFGIAGSHVESTMLGMRAGLSGQPIRVETPVSGGYVDLLPFRPWDELYDLDAAAMTMEIAMFPPSVVALAEKVAAISRGYDVVLVDHRTGIAPSVPSWIYALPGPIIAFARMDGQWRSSRSYLRSLWEKNPRLPGLIVSFKPDDEGFKSYVHRNYPQVSDLLSDLATVMSSSNDDSELLVGDDVSDHWIVWPYDSGFRTGAVPGVDKVGEGIRQAVSDVRRILELVSRPTHAISKGLHPSGAQDDGDLIQTQALRTLMAPNNPYLFIKGRKGTGKTRLLRALAQSGIGEALLVPDDDSGRNGVNASDTALKELIESTRNNAEHFWWTLLSVALAGGDTNRKRMSEGVRKLTGCTEDGLDSSRRLAKSVRQRRVFLVDGLETAFPRNLIFEYVGALFRLVASIGADDVLSRAVQIKVFIRTDLADRGFENVEQQMHGRTLSLSWDTQSILNFALSRISALSWFRMSFPKAADIIRERQQDILLGNVSVDDCDAILLGIFPDRLRRQNMKTTTFLRTWFTDDPKGQVSYYPRVYDEFLRLISNDGGSREGFAGADVQDGRISDGLIFWSHERASESFLKQVKTELLHLIDLQETDLTKLLDAFRSTITPFQFKVRVDELAQATRLSGKQIEQALQQMKTLGIFESRPGFSGEWRAGRLFKTSLGMIYDRRRK